MTEADLRAVLLLRALAAAPGSGWRADDEAWAGREARRQLGEQAGAQAWLACRARLGLSRLGERDAALRPWLAAATAPAGRGLATALLVAAALAGLLAEPLGASRHINLLAPPLLGLLAWNLGVYGLLLGRAIGRLAGRRQGGAAPVRPPALLAWLRGLIDRQTRPPAGMVAGDTASALAGAWARFGHDWWAASRALQAARGLALLHAAAALLALGLLAAMYARGLVFDFRAGWDSTLLDAAAVRRLAGALLGPAAAISGVPLPEPAAWPGLRLADGGGEGAARWIHLWAWTLGGAVVLPRLLLAALAARQSRRLAADLPLPADAADLQRLLHAASAEARVLQVLPYSYQLDGARTAALQRWLRTQEGPGLRCTVQPTLPLGAEDDLPRWLPAPLPPTVVALFAATATPERETHGALLRALRARLAGGGTLQVLVDESGLRQRLPGAAGAERRTQRRAAWLALGQAEGVVPQFVDLAEVPPA